MSVVAVRVTSDAIEIAADSIQVRGYTQSRDKAAKLFQTNLGLIIGSSGMSETLALFRNFAESHVPKAPTVDAVTDYIAEFHGWFRKKTEDASRNIDNNDFLLIFRSSAFYIHGYYVQEITSYEAIGAGSDYALAALYLGTTAEKAVEAACELSIYCEQPINVIRVSVPTEEATR